MDTKGIAMFAGLAFGGGYLIQAALLLPGFIKPYEPGLFGYAGLVAIFIWPAAAAAMARQKYPVQEKDSYNLWPLPTSPTLRAIILVPLVFIVGNCMAWALGWTSPDWGMSKVIHLIKQNAMEPLPAEVEPILPGVMLVGGVGFSILLGITVFTALMLACEYAWRAYLLPKLQPLGGLPALLFAAIAPFIYGVPYFVYAYVVAPEALDDLPEALVRFLAVCISTGILFGVVWNRTRHLGLLAVLAGTVMGHMFGIWNLLFATQYWWFTGSTGLIICALWLVLAAFPNLMAPARQG